MDQNPTKEPRSAVNLRIKFRSESLEQFVERYAIDVSRGGIFIRTREPLAVGTQLKLDFQYQGGAPLMAGDGTVVWIREPDPNRPAVPPGMGVRFDRLTPESQAVLEQLLAEKAAREKNAPVAAGGMAVRRPSSIFAALEQNEAKTTVGPMPTGPSSPRNVEPVNPHAHPPRYSIAAMPLVSTSGAPGTSGSTGATAKPPATPRGGAVGTPSASAAPVTATESSAPGYKPLGTARNPFSVGPGAAAKEPSSAAAQMAAAVFGSGQKSGESAAGAPPLSLRQMSNAGADDLEDEPTQIAGRMPAFLTTDEDPTSVGARPSAPDSRITTEQPAATGRNLAKLTSSPSLSPDGPAARAFGATLPGAGGRTTGHGATVPADGARVKPSLDSAPPVGEVRRGAVDRGTDALLDPEPRLSRSGLGMPEQPRPFDPLAAFGSAPNFVGEDAAPAPTPPPTAAVRPTSPKPMVTAPLSAALPGAKPAPRRSSGAILVVTVLALGGAAFFVFKFFAAQSAQVAMAPSSVATAILPPPNPTTALAGNEPAKGEPGAPSGEPVKPEGATPAVAEAKPTEVKPAETKPTETKPGEGNPAEAKAPEGKPGEGKASEAKPGEAKPGEGKASEAKPGEAKPSEAKAAAKPGEAKAGESKSGEVKAGQAKPSTALPPSKSLASAESTGSRKAVVKRKPGRGGRDTEAAAAPEPAEAPAAAGAAASTATAGPAPGHQIRVTSKPSGADVAIDGQVVGQTPLSTGISDVSSPHFVSVRREGFEPFEQMISATSAWAKGKPVKGQPAIPTLKINAKLKSSGGGVTGDKVAPPGDGVKDAPAAKADPDSPAPPSDTPPGPPAP